MRLLLERVRQAGASNSRIASVIIISAFVVLTSLFATGTLLTQLTHRRAITPAQALSPQTSAPCATLSWTQLSPTGTGPDINSQQFVSDGQGNLIIFGGCGPTGCNTSTDTFVLRDAFGVAGLTQWLQPSPTG